MWLRGIFRPKQNSAEVAHERLRAVLVHQRAEQRNPDFIPKLRRELLNVLRTYVKGQPQEVKLFVERETEHDTIEFSVVFQGGSIQERRV